MKSILIALLIGSPLWLHSQQGVVATGGHFQGPGGTMSSSTGQTDYYVIESNQFSLQFGLQQNFKSDAPCTVTFNVDMSYATGFDPETDVVYITGTMIGPWAEPGSDPENQLMTPGEGAMVYTKTLYLPKGTYEYKYFLNNGWAGGEWQGEINRQVIVQDHMETYDLWGHFILDVVAQPEEGGTVSGGGIYSFNAQVLVEAQEAEGFEFANWTKNDMVVTTLPSFNFNMPSQDVTLVANFQPTGIETVSTIAELRSKPSGETLYRYTGQAVITAIPGMPSPNQPFIYSDFDDNQNVTFNGWPNTPTIIENPDASGINTSSMVAQWQRAEEQYAHVYTELGGKIDLSNQQVFKMKIWSPIACEVMFKLEDKTNNSISVEIPKTVSNTEQWVELSYDFSGSESGIYDKIVIFMDFATTTNNTFYFDDVTGPGYDQGDKLGPLSFKSAKGTSGSNYNRKFIQDETAAIVIFDEAGIITTPYNLYDVITNVTGHIEVVNNMVRFVPFENTAPAIGNTPISPTIFTMDQPTSDDQSKLVKFFNVVFSDLGDDAVFVNGGFYTLEDGENPFSAWADFYDVDYIGQIIPTEPLNITGIIQRYYNVLQITPRFAADIEEYTGEVNLSLNVDMRRAYTFDNDEDLVYVTGSMFQWATPGSQPEDQLMSCLDESWFYQKNIMLQPGVHQYKYFINDGWGNAEWPETINRQVTFEQAMTVYNTWGIPGDAFPLSFAVEDGEGTPITDAIITLVDFTYNPGEYDLGWFPAGIWSYSVEKEGFKIFNGSLNMNEEETLEVVVLETDEVEPCNPPDWVPISGLQFNMQVTAKIIIDDEVSLNPNDILGAFVNGECRGVASPNPALGGLMFLTVGSNVAYGETVDLVIWDSENCEPCQTYQTITFSNLQQVGTPGNPYLAECKPFVEFTLDLEQGYTWFSINVNPGSMELDVLLQSLEPCENDRVIGQGNYAVFFQNGWVGSLEEIIYIQGYKIDLCSPGQVYILGEPVPVFSVTHGAGFSWIGFTPQDCMEINYALQSLDPPPSENDRLIGQDNFAIFYNGSWIGSLKNLCPGQGFVIDHSSQSSFIFGDENPSKDYWAGMPREANTNTQSLRMKNTMTLVGQLLDLEGRVSASPRDVVIALVNGQPRGAASPTEEMDGIIFLNIASNLEQGETVNFIAWKDEEGHYVELQEKITFQSLGAEGTINEPFLFHPIEPTGQLEIPQAITHIGDPYPNPARGMVYLPYTLQEESRVTFKMVNATGQVVVERELSQQQPGKYQMEIDSFGLQAGVYFFKALVDTPRSTIQKTGILVISH